MSDKVEWSMSQERVFMEDLVYKRLTLLIAFVAAVLAGAINLFPHPILQAALLFAGAVVSWLLRLTVVRAHQKMVWISDRLKERSDHPLHVIQEAFPRGSVNRLVGVWLPHISTVVLAIAFVVAIVSGAPFREVREPVSDGRFIQGEVIQIR